MNLETFTDDTGLTRWITVPTISEHEKEPFELQVVVPGELELTGHWQACKKKEVLEIPDTEKPQLARHRQRRATRRPQFHVDDSDTDFVKLAGICADTYLKDWRGLYTQKDHKLVKFDLTLFKEKILPRIGIWFVNELFGLVQEFAGFQEDEQAVVKKT